MKKEKTNGLISIIIPVFNREESIKRTLESVYEQTYRPLEIIVVNDGSTDSTQEIVLIWKKNHESKNLLIKSFLRSNQGAPASRNYGLQHCTGEFIQFLDSDDYMHPLKIQNQKEKMEANNSDVAVCDFAYVDETGSIKKIQRNSGKALQVYSKGGSFSLSTPLFKSAFVRKGLRWDESLKRNQDIDFLFKLFLLTKRYFYTEGVWFFYVQHSSFRISDSYKITKPEYKKRIATLLLFGFRNLHLIPLRNIIFLFSGIYHLTLNWILYLPKKIIKTSYPHLAFKKKVK